MTTNTAQVLPPARQDPRQVSNTLKKTLNWNDAGGIANGVPFDNSIPMGAVITSVLVEVITAFDGTTPTIVVGTNSTSYNNIVASGDIDETVVGTALVTRALGGSLARLADVIPYIKATLTNATAGQIQVTITFEGGWVS